MFSSSTIDKNFVIKLQAFAIFKLKYKTSKIQDKKIITYKYSGLKLVQT